MTAPGAAPRAGRAWPAALMLLVGFLGHLIAAHLNGGSQVAYLHHVVGFFLILVVTGVVILGVGRLLWRGRTDITLFVIAVVQALMGAVVVYLERGAA
jgi:uncharacterized membrane protein